MEYTAFSYRRLNNADNDQDPTVDDIELYNNKSKPSNTTRNTSSDNAIKSKNGKETQNTKRKKKRYNSQDFFKNSEMTVEEGDEDYDGRRKTSSGCPSGLWQKWKDSVGIRTFVAVVCLYVVTFGMLEMYIVAVITTIEKRFGFRSSSSGMLLSAKEIAYVIIVTPSSHYANKWHRPRFLSLMAVLGAFGNALSALPHFLYDSPFHVAKLGNVTQDENNPEFNKFLCYTLEDQGNINNLSTYNNGTRTTISPCADDLINVAHNEGAYAILVISSVIVGVAVAPMIALTTTYVDDAVGPVKNALYLAFMNMMRPLGPVLAFLMGALFTSFHESMEDPGYDATDRRWIGAWWVGYLSNPCLLLVAAIIIAFFPKSFPKEEDVPGEKTIEMQSKEEKKRREQEKPNVAVDMLSGVGRLMCNPVYVFLMVGGCFSSFVVSGMFPFMPKYIEVQFHLSASQANTLTGMIGALLAGIGVLLGGILSSCLKWKPAQSALFIFLTDVVFVGAILFMMVITCPTRQYVGSSQLAGNTSCSAACGCAENDFSPVCGSDGFTYMSPCVAGCKTHFNNRTYGGCSCQLNTNRTTDSAAAWSGPCESDCHMWMPYMAVLAVGALIGMMASVPATTICLRCVEERDRSLALGFTGTVVSLASFLPGPMLYGFLIDSTCLNWQETCGATGYCRLYDTKQFRLRLHGVTAVLKGVAGIFYLLVWVAMRREKKTLTFSTIIKPKNTRDQDSLSSGSSESIL